MMEPYCIAEKPDGGEILAIFRKLKMLFEKTLETFRKNTKRLWKDRERRNSVARSR